MQGVRLCRGGSEFPIVSLSVGPEKALRPSGLFPFLSVRELTCRVMNVKRAKVSDQLRTGEA